MSDTDKTEDKHRVSGSELSGLVIWALLEVGYEGGFLHSVYDSKRVALKEMLALKRKCVAENLEAQRQFGKDLSRDFYKDTWTNVSVVVEQYDVRTAI